ncbi:MULTISPECIES: NUDIX hydrolase [Kaistia]|uniref:NUDIX hydrolase n=1 Tax=Kaistia nematophila TaxID=2994654 RepID=A0A9X3E135_9HYPH|nr:NUDIX hydrolase [Kaistia nematophila]MCX5568642.1 NUDIX hydrolase [Kaistia nematophila]
MDELILERPSRWREPLEEGDVFQQFGALPWRRNKHGEIRVLLVTSRERGRWLFPKGWLAPGRSAPDSAATEAFEEAGVVGDIHREALGSYSYAKILNDQSSVDCIVTMFPLRVRGTLLEWRERCERKRRWCHLSEAVEIVSDEGLGRLLREIQADDRLKALCGR